MLSTIRELRGGPNIAEYKADGLKPEATQKQAEVRP